VILGGRVRFRATGRALRHRNFRLFFFGQLISVSGTWMQSLALGWLLGTIVGWDQAVVYIGLLGVVQFLPVMVLGLFGGIIADIWPKRRLVIATQTLAGLLALASRRARLHECRGHLADLRAGVPARAGQRRRHAGPPVVRRGDGRATTTWPTPSPSTRPSSTGLASWARQSPGS
jgi:hypothetical protein